LNIDSAFCLDDSFLYFSQATTPQNFFDLNYLSDLFKYCALSSVVNVGQDFQQKLGEVEGNLAAAVNCCALELCNAVRAHCGLFLLTNFVRAVDKVRHSHPPTNFSLFVFVLILCVKVEDKPLKAVLSRLVIMYSLSSILDDPQWNGLLNTAQIRLIKQAVIEVMEQLRPDAVALVDAFDFPDRVLNSAIGRYDGTELSSSDLRREKNSLVNEFIIDLFLSLSLSLSSLFIGVFDP
jgi:acyl-CoA oxidase